MSTYDSLPRFGINRSPLGLTVVQSDQAVKSTYLFPLSKNRSKRIHKKLMKRFGRQVDQTPAAYMVGGKLVVHPTLYRELLDQVEDVAKRQARNLFDMGQLNQMRPDVMSPDRLAELSRQLTNAYPAEDRLVPRYNSED